MNELITVDFSNQTVSARELHEKLNIKSKYADWFKNMTAYGFIENEDYKSISKNLENGGRTIEHDISIDMAKEICMIQRSQEGKMIREYFINLENAWNSPEQLMARALKVADRTIDSLKMENETLVKKIELDKPKTIFADAVNASYTSILVGDLAKIICQNGINIGQKRLFEWMRENGYLIKRNGSDYNMPTQRAMEKGLFEIKESSIPNPDGSIRVTRTVKVTGAGQIYFVNKFMNGRAKKND